MTQISTPSVAGAQPTITEHQPPSLLPGEYGCISLHEPWVACIFHHGKRIENRTWALPAKYLNTPVLIQAAKHRETVKDAIYWLRQGPAPGLNWGELHFGQVVGAVVFTSGHYSDATSKWGMSNRFWWKIGTAWRLNAPFDCRGHQRWWTVQTTRILEMTRCEDHE